MIEFCKKNYGMMFALVILWGFQFILLPFIHYHPEITHSHIDQAEVHQHSGRYHSATLEAYAHLVSGHFSDSELDNHFHHSHSSEENDESDSGFYILAKYSKSLKQGKVSKQIGLPLRLELSNPLISLPALPGAINFNSRSGTNPHSSRAPPSIIL